MQSKKKSRSSIKFITLLILATILIKLLALNSSFVEKYYATGFFVSFSKIQRMLTGWIPFSIGDILYLFAGLWLLYKIFKFILKIIKEKNFLSTAGRGVAKLIFIGAGVYIIFNIFWGLNYNRKGITYQLNLDTAKYSVTDLKHLQKLLIEKINNGKQNLINNHSFYPTNKELFIRATNCYRQATAQYPFIKYEHISIKRSMFGKLGNYLGFTGYHNPFTGEAQLNTTVPKFIQPYVACHEIGHQLGYAKEDEANFAGYLAATSSSDSLFKYSTYLDLFLYANRELYYADSTSAKQAFQQISPEVKTDIKEWRDFLIKHRSFLDTITTWIYGKYLKANQQPQGMHTYNDVIVNLIVFYKKTGRI